MSVVHEIRQQLREYSNPDKAAFLPKFFKLEPGDTDDFLGVIVPNQRKIVKQFYTALTPQDVLELLHSNYHEERLTALLIWVRQYQAGDQTVKQLIYDLYLRNTKWINNWDLVDSSASYIVGNFIYDKDRSVLVSLSKSTNIWERRIAILAAGEFIKYHDFAWTLRLAKQNLHDSHHYIHKATGWMLREVGKRDEVVLCNFLDTYAHKMPRTMLRYAIERLSSEKRTKYLHQT